MGMCERQVPKVGTVQEPQGAKSAVDTDILIINSWKKNLRPKE